MSLPLLKYALLAALRDKLLLSMFVVFMVGASLSVFLASSAIIEKDQFTLVFTAASLRLVSVLGLVLFVVFFVRRSFDSKDIEFLLSRPLSRVQVIVTYAIAFSLIAVLMTMAVGVALYSVAPHLFGLNHVIWLISVVLESVAMVCVSLFFAMQITSAASAAMASLGVYVLGRLMGQLLGIIDSTLVDGQGLYAMALQIVSVITPRLDLLGQSSWLLYGVNSGDIFFAFVQVFSFSLLVVSAACLDFSRRQF